MKTTLTPSGEPKPKAKDITIRSLKPGDPVVCSRPWTTLIGGLKGICPNRHRPSHPTLSPRAMERNPGAGGRGSELSTDGPWATAAPRRQP